MEKPGKQENRFRTKKRSKWFWALAGTAGVVFCTGAYVVVMECFIDTLQHRLIESCENGYYSTGEILRGGADPNTRRRDGKTCLTLALEGSHPYVAASLLDSGADIHDDELMLLCNFLTGERDDYRRSEDKYEVEKLHEALRNSLNSVHYKGSGLKPFVSMALQKGNARLLELLCSSDRYKGEDFNRAIVFAIDTDNMKLLKELAAKPFCGKNVDKTLVKYALEKNKPLMSLELVNSGAAFEGNEKEILFRAIELRPDLWSRLAFEHRQTVCDYAGEFFLRAAKYGRTEIIKRLIAPRNKDMNILIAAVEESDGEDSGVGPWPEVDLKSYGIDALFDCLQSGKCWEIVRLLLDAGVDVNALSRDDVKQTLLQAYLRDFSSPAPEEEFVRYLLEKGINVNAKDASGLTALHIVQARYGVAARREDRAAVEVVPSISALLIQNGADVRACTDSGLTPFMIAAWVGAYKDVFHLMLQKGADVNARDKHGFTALMWATVNGQYDTMQALLAANADVNAATPTGATALSFALQKYDAEAVRILLAAGADADTSTIDAAAREAAILQYSRENNDRDILNLLRKMPGLNINYMLKKHRFPSEKEAIK